MTSRLPNEEGASVSWQRCPSGAFGQLASKLRRRQRRVFLRNAAVLTTMLAAGGGLWLWLGRGTDDEVLFGGITCSEVRSLAAAYVRGELGAQQHEQVRQHLTHCPRCRSLIRSMGMVL